MDSWELKSWGTPLDARERWRVMWRVLRAIGDKATNDLYAVPEHFELASLAAQRASAERRRKPFDLVTRLSVWDLCAGPRFRRCVHRRPLP